jgi:hypothetical protein
MAARILSSVVARFGRSGSLSATCLALVAVSVATPTSLGASAPVAPALASSLRPLVPLDEGWKNPPPLARTRVWWWWLNGNVDRAGLTRDLEELRAKGFGGANIIDAGGDEQRGNRRVPHGPDFASPAWRELFVHALAEADRLGLELGFNIQSGWNLGGPTVRPENAAKTITFTETSVTGGGRVSLALPAPKALEDFYRDVAVLAYPARGQSGPKRTDGIPDLEQKAYFKYPGRFTATAAWHLLTPGDPLPEDVVIRPDEVRDLTVHLSPSGTLDWDAPPGEWRILRLGYTLKGSHVSTHSEGGGGRAIDYLDATAFETYWREVLAPMFAAARPYLGRSLRYLHTDSWELGPVNWTRLMPDEFRRRRGYDLRPFLPVFANRVVGSREVATRFLNDFRRTLAELIAENKYQAFSRHARAHGLGIHPESGGPHAAPIDALRNLGLNDLAMGEFWAPSPTHRVKLEERFFVKQTSSAAHIYGRRISLAEAFTSIGPQWEEDPRSLKSTFDRAACEGHNLTMWHTFSSTPASAGVPGQAYFAGTHLNPNVTWWPQAGAFIAYLNRCHFLLQQGLPVGDVLHFYGENIPSFVRLKADDPARTGGEYDYDVIDLEALLTRTRTDATGRIVLPDGTSYALLSLTPHDAISLPALRHVASLVRAGATLTGRRPARPYSLSGYPEADREFAALAEELWGPADRGADVAAGPRLSGRGRVYGDVGAQAVLRQMGVARDFTWQGAATDTIDYLHRRTDTADVYFVANLEKRSAAGTAEFRVVGRRPELWDPVTGAVRPAAGWREADGRTRVPLRLAADQSVFVVFRTPAAATGAAPAPPAAEEREPAALVNLRGPWAVRFDPKWGGPAEEIFDELTDWAEHPEEGIRHYSGAATYAINFGLPALPEGRRVYLDLGELRNLAEVELNEKPLGVLWTSPFRVEVTGLLRERENHLRVKVVNLWPNRLIGDQKLPPEARRTKTNITKFEQPENQRLLPSGLFGPVRVLVER